jgi:hypothetical protein
VSVYGTAVYGADTYGVPSGVWPFLQVWIGTTREAESLILDDPDRGLLDDATLGDNLGFVWENITESIVDDGVRINRGSTRSQGPYFRYEAGAATFRLVNQDGTFDPTNPSSIYTVAGQTQLRPSLPVRIDATYQGVTYPLFIGYVTQWDVTYPSAGTSVSTVDVACTDAVGVLAAADKAASPEQGSSDTVADRIDRVLDNVGWPVDGRSLEVSATESLRPTTMSQPAWTDILLAVDSFNGYAYAERTGTIVYRTKSSFPRRPSVRFGEDGIAIDDLRVTSDVEQVFNVVKLGRVNSSVVAVEDSDSRALYGLRGFSRSDLLCSTDDQVSESLDYILSQFADLQLRVESVRVSPTDAESASTWQQLLDLEVLTRMATTVSTPDGREIEIEGLVRGISLDVTRFGWRWTLSTTQAPDRGGEFTLDSETDGLLAQFTEFQVQVLTGFYDWLASPVSGYAAVAATVTFEDLIDTITINPFPPYNVIRRNIGALQQYLQTLAWSPSAVFQFNDDLTTTYDDQLSTLVSAVADSPDYPELAAF